ncbi:MAG: hypothetical protein L3J11_01825 [Draconibacterium sp.]|nr:hypothetical protein [Draconibacterium sp.]
MQTHMCLEAATRTTHDLAYKCTVVEDARATQNIKYGEVTILVKNVHFSTLSTLKSYGKVINLKSCKLINTCFMRRYFVFLVS